MVQNSRNQALCIHKHRTFTKIGKNAVFVDEEKRKGKREGEGEKGRERRREKKREEERRGEKREGDGHTIEYMIAIGSSYKYR